MKTLLSALKKAENAVILPHKSADGDAIASCMALGKLLLRWGIPYTICLEEPVRSDLAFLGGDFAVLGDRLPVPHTAIAVDCGDAARLGERLPLFEGAKVKIVIDHHVTNAGFGDVCVVDPSAAATAEIIAGLFDLAGEPFEDAASPLYTGLVTDTGGFRFSNTTPKTLRVAAQLMEAGAESRKICLAVFEENPLEKIRLEAAVMHEMTICHNGKTAVATVTEALLSETGASDEDTSHISGLLRGIRGVETGVLLREKDGQIKISMRTSQVFDAAAFCKTLGGGGHARAAGATVEGDISEWKEEIIKRIGEAYGRHC